MQIVNIPYITRHQAPFSQEEIDEIVAMDHVDPELAILHVAELIDVSTEVAEQLVSNIVLARITAGMKTVDPDALPF